MPKRSIRSRFLAQRRSHSVALCEALSLAVQQRFLHSKLYRDANFVALYCAVHNEVLTDLVASQSIDDGKTLVYPRVNEQNLEFVRVSGTEALAPGTFGVMEPQTGPLVPVGELDLVVVPGVVFDRNGHRLGYGRGYYDRTLAVCRPGCERVGFAYDFQLIDELPSQHHDQTLSVLFSESKTMNFTA